METETQNFGQRIFNMFDKYRELAKTTRQEDLLRFAKGDLDKLVDSMNRSERAFIRCIALRCQNDNTRELIKILEKYL